MVHYVDEDNIMALSLETINKVQVGERVCAAVEARQSNDHMQATSNGRLCLYNFAVPKVEQYVFQLNL